MKSCLYECQISHQRLSPRKHSFNYGGFFFYLDLDEIDEVTSRSVLLRGSRPAVYAFGPGDFIDRSERPLKEKVLHFVNSQSTTSAAKIEQVTLLTTLRTFGYLFNPVSVYYCFSGGGDLVCAIAEVTNTFYESKLYFLDNEPEAGKDSQQRIKARKPKYFYVSPFSQLDTTFDFNIPVPGDELQLNINTLQHLQPTLLSGIKGRKVALTTGAIARLSLCYPLMSLRVIFLIHWQALKLFLKGMPFIRKEANANLQIDVRHPHRSLTGENGKDAAVVESIVLESPPHS